MYLGNLDIPSMERRMGIKFPDDLITYMQDKHQDLANTLARDKWHCYDLPFVLHVENMAMAEIIFKYLSPFSKDVKNALEIGIQEAP